MPDIRPKLLIVEDDAGLQRQLRWSYDEYSIVMAADRAEAIELLRAESPPVVTLDLGLPPDPDGVSEGFAVLEDILRIAPETKVIVASGHGDRESARRSIALGAWDFYQKPVDLDSLRHIVGRAFHVHRLEAENRRLASRGPADQRILGRIVTGAPEMATVARMAERAAASDAPVWLSGAAGTGKRLLARALHEAGGRAEGPFVTVEGAGWTDADSFDADWTAARGGTLYLVTPEAVPAAGQSLLIAAMRDGGGSVRLIAGSLDQGCGALRDTLAQAVIALPPLAARTGDAALLARYFTARDAPALNPGVAGLAADALTAVAAFGWPGNIRALEERIRQALLRAEGRMLTARDIDLSPDGAAVPPPLSLRAAREAAERHAVEQALARCAGNLSDAARLLGISRPTLYALLKAHDMQP